MSLMDQSRHFDSAPRTSALVRSADIADRVRQVRKVPNWEVLAKCRTFHPRGYNHILGRPTYAARSDHDKQVTFDKLGHSALHTLIATTFRDLESARSWLHRSDAREKPLSGDFLPFIQPWDF